MAKRATVFALVLFFLPGCLSLRGQCDFAEEQVVRAGETVRMRGRTVGAEAEGNQAFSFAPPLVVKYCDADDHDPHVTIFIRDAAPKQVAISGLREDDRVFLSGSGKTLDVGGYRASVTVSGKGNAIYTRGDDLLIACTSSAYDNRVIQLNSKGIALYQHGDDHRNTIERFGEQ